MDYQRKIRDNTVVSASGCWEWNAYRLPGGYGRTRYHNQNILAHRLAWTVFNGTIPKGKQVCHKCDNPCCCNPDHLFLGTPKANWKDSRRKGRDAVSTGKLAAASRFRRIRKLTHEQVAEIRSSTEMTRQLAERMETSWQNVWMIRTGRRKTAPMRHD